MNALDVGLYALRYFGPRIALLRARVVLDQRLGITRRAFRPRPWNSILLAEICRAGVPADDDGYAAFKQSQDLAFLFPLGRPPLIPAEARAGGERRPALADRLKLYEQGRAVYFFHEPSRDPIDWYDNQLTGGRGDASGVWCDIPDFRPQQGDARTLWEPARAAWAVDLGRARAHAIDFAAGAVYWRWVDSWMSACPPWQGFHWKCGQESAVRFIALTLGFWSLARDPATTPARFAQIARLAWATGYRVAHHIGYAVSQKNNHALSEAAGLMLIAHLFPELREAEAWAALGRRVLAGELRRQIYADGSYVQHSLNYQRVALQDALLGLRLAELAGRPFAREDYDRVGRCGEFVRELMEPANGRVPNYGNNDGALVLPLSECDFTDFRPLVQAVHFLVRRRRLLPPGPWDEDLYWLFGEREVGEHAPAETRAGDALSAAPRPSRAFEDGGYYVLRSGESWAMMRCHAYRDRPAHCDPLHVDLWRRGENVLLDCGTWQYYAPAHPTAELYFKSTAAHNTMELGGRDAMEPVSRFLWLPWLRCRRLDFVTGEAASWVSGEYRHTRGERPVIHRRTLLALPGDVWLVADDLIGAGRAGAVLRWHLCDRPCSHDPREDVVRLDAQGGPLFLRVVSATGRAGRMELCRGRDEPGRVQGFVSPCYGVRRPAPAIEVTIEEPLPLRVVTLLAPDAAATVRRRAESVDGERWELTHGGVARAISLAPLKAGVRRVVLGIH